MDDFAPRGTGNASLFGATEGVLLLAAASEAILIAGLVLVASRVGAGSVVGQSFLRLNELLLGPFGRIPLPGGAAAIGRQLAAVVGYGLLFLLIIGGVSWLDRRRVFS